MRLQISQAPQNRRVFGLVSELEERVAAIVRHFPEDLAMELLPHLQKAAPNDIPRYAQLLGVRRFQLAGVDSAAGIMVAGYAHAHRLTEADAPRTVLFIRPKVRAGEAMDPGSVVLWRANPWTMGTLPYEPPKRVASILSRRVSAREAAEIDRRRTMDLPMVVQELRALGVAITRVHPVRLERRVTRDLAWEVLRREFGLGDAPHVAHWRPTLRYAKTVLARHLFKSYLRWLSVPSEHRWERPLTTKFGKVGDVKRIQGFQAYIRV